MFACTGFLVSERHHLLTAQHCITPQAAVDSLEVTFDYQLPSCGGGAPARFEIYVGDRLVLADPSLDVALPTLKGEPASQHGFLPLSRRALAPGEALYLPQHARGGVKKVSVLGCEVSDPQVDGRSRGSDFGHQCDTEPGSSGAPVLDLENQVVGLHRFGGCTELGGENQAVRMSRALPALPAQRTVLALESGRLDFGQGGATGLLRLKARLTLGLDGDGIAPLAEAVTLTLGDGDGAFYSATIGAGAFRREGKSFLFADPLGSVAGGLRFLRLTPMGAFTYLVGVGGRRIDFSGADRDDITVTLTIGDDTALGTAHFERRPRALVLP